MRCKCLAAFVFALLPLLVAGQIDVSKYQGTVNWKSVKKSGKVQFVYVKATEGASIKDPLYKQNVDNARANGILVGSYHVYSKKTTAYKQFNNFKSVVKKDKQDLRPVLDIEAGYCADLYMERVDKILELMEKEYGVKPMIYTSEKVYNTHFTGKKYSSYHFFIANYKKAPTCRYTLWQYSDSERIKGIGGGVDMSKFHKNHSLVDLKVPKKKKVEKK